MVATFFFQRTTAFTLFLIVPSLQISCFRKTKEKQYAKYDLNKRIAARLIWQLVIHSCVIFAYIISRRDGENNGFLAGVPSFPSSSRAPRVTLAPKTPFPFPFKRLPSRLCLTDFKTYSHVLINCESIRVICKVNLCTEYYSPKVALIYIHVRPTPFACVRQSGK